MEKTTYIIETDWRGNKIIVTGDYDGQDFVITELKPAEGIKIPRIFYVDIQNEILRTKFKK